MSSPCKNITKLNKHKLLLKELIHIWGMLAGVLLLPQMLIVIKKLIFDVYFIAAAYSNSFIICHRKKIAWKKNTEDLTS